jgi:hypothetical protein
MAVSVKIEGIDDVKRFLRRKHKEIFDAGADVIDEHSDKVLTSAKSKINSISGETAASLKKKVEKTKNAVVSRVGTIDATKEECIRANSLEYGHAAPNDRGGVKIVEEHPFERPALAEDKRSFVHDMKQRIQDVADRS